MQKARENIDKTWSITYARLKKKSILTFLIFPYLCITIPLAAKLNIWIDEAYSLETTGKDLSYALHQSLYFELQPPLYFVLLNIWRNLNHSVFFARLFSIICIAITIYLVKKLTHKWLKRIRPTWIISALFTFSPFTIWAALEIRLYAFLILLSSILWLTFYDGYFVDSPSPRKRFFYTILSIVALYTQYYSVFLLVANGGVLLFLKRWKDFQNYLANMVLVAICFTPMISVITSQISIPTSTINQFSSFKDSFYDLIRRLGSYNLTISWIYSKSQGNWTLYLYALLGSALIVILIKYRGAILQSHIAVWINTFVIFIFFVIARTRLGNEVFEMRHTAIFFLPSIFSVFAFFSLIEKVWRDKIIVIWVVAGLLLSTGSLYTTYKPLAKTGDFARVADYIMAEEKPNQPILMFNAEVKVAFVNYYSGMNSLITIPKEQTFQSYEPHDFVFQDEKDLLVILSQVPTNHTYIWVVKNDLCGYLGIDYQCDRFEESLQKYYSLETRKEFLGSEVRLMRRQINAQ